jgi:tetratricopeptide (TPR) repeat protein
MLVSFLSDADVRDRKKQFLRRISEWGFEKNVKRDERRAILEKLGGGAKEGEFEATLWRGRRLDKAKIERWRKREGLSGNESQMAHEDISGKTNHTLLTMLLMRSEGKADHNSDLREASHSTSPQMEICDEDGGAVDKILRHGMEPASIPMDEGQMSNPWLVVDVIGSPRLTGLIGAMTLESCDNIPDLDLSAPHTNGSQDAVNVMDMDELDNDPEHKETQNQQTPVNTASSGTSFTIAALGSHFLKDSYRRIPDPLDELYPFPSAEEPKTMLRYPRINHLISMDALKAKEVACKRSLKDLKSIKRTATVELTETMRCIAWRYSELGKPRSAELWWRRVVTTYLKLPGSPPTKVLHACLEVAENVRQQGRPAECMGLHRDIHDKIMKLLRPDHELTIISKAIQADSYSNFGHVVPVEAIYRELLQICLHRFGPRNTYTLEMLEAIGWTLIQRHQYEEAEAILCSRVQLDYTTSRYSAQHMTDVHNLLASMSLLAKCLRLQEKYDDCKELLNTIEVRFKKLTCDDGYSWKWFHVEKAKALIIEGRQHESEKILQDVLSQAPDHPDMCILNTMKLLASLLKHNYRGAEAVMWYKKIFLIEVQMYGINNKYSMEDCREVGICYVDLGRFDDAIIHFEQAAKMLVHSQAGDSDSRIDHLVGLWIYVWGVHSMREKAPLNDLVPPIEEFFDWHDGLKKGSAVLARDRG